ncbi:hypothetical protein NGM33_28405 [Nocardiopsis dassonvillei]|uniref:hypothetical protein n=1 Tax=Nocardiopsis dassonvillei TaxID=2014 RepID=UPI0020A48C1D|nr:hypothetical protein [Nocardiopsis dassonvillei]MCP3017258.1 hypothetical protein [Nocardiopsis dassonvillei]
MADRDIRADLGIPKDWWPDDAAKFLTRVAELAEGLADDANAAEHEWSAWSAQSHTGAAEWLRWLIDELDEEGDDRG